MTAGPIPWTATQQWAREHGVRDVARFEYLIQRMDAVLLTREEQDDDG